MKTKLIFSWVIALSLIIASCSKEEQKEVDVPVTPDTFVMPGSETFTFSSNGIDIDGKIFLPDAYETNDDLPAIYLMDYREEDHWPTAYDEAEQVLRGIEKITGLDALVVTLDSFVYFDVEEFNYEEYNNVFKDMTTYVDSIYTTNTSRTYMGRGSEGGAVLLSLFTEDQQSAVFSNFIVTDSPPDFNILAKQLIENNKVPEDLLDKKLHFSFSSSNDRNLCIDLIESIEEANYPWLMFESKGYSTDFINSYRLSYAAGLKFVFEE